MNLQEELKRLDDGVYGLPDSLAIAMVALKDSIALNKELVAALSQMMGSHFNLYKMGFGEHSIPDYDIPRRGGHLVLDHARELGITSEGE